MAKRIFERYPWPDPEPSDYRDWFSVLGSDFVIDCPTRNVSNIYAAHGLDTYFYNFNHSWEVPGLWGPNMTFCEGHSCHGGELPFDFSSANKSIGKGMSLQGCRISTRFASSRERLVLLAWLGT